jgi:glyoxylase-like metal-dependent hydrolase (beta-lactamase superfamily II)
MFIVTSQGVIATDPISYLRPAKPYLDAIKAVTDKPIKYVIYSHHHYDHIAGGQPFKDLGATFIAHRRARERLLELKKLAALDWDRLIPGHPYAGERFGTKKDVEDDIAYLEDLSAEVKKAADVGKCFDTAMKEVKLPKYEKWANYETGLSANVERFCYWWGRGY